MWRWRGSVVDLWVREGTRAVPSQCSGPHVSFSAVRDSNRAPYVTVPTSGGKGGLSLWLLPLAPTL